MTYIKCIKNLALFCLAVQFKLMPASCYAGQMSYLWSSTGTGTTGSIQYQGTVIDTLSTKVNWRSGNMRVVYVGSCDGSAVGTYTYYRYDDKWFSVPSSISLNGVQIPISVTVDNFTYLQQSGLERIYKQRTE